MCGAPGSSYRAQRCPIAPNGLVVSAGRLRLPLHRERGRRDSSCGPLSVRCKSGCNRLRCGASGAVVRGRWCRTGAGTLSGAMPSGSTAEAKRRTPAGRGSCRARRDPIRAAARRSVVMRAAGAGRRRGGNRLACGRGSSASRFSARCCTPSPHHVARSAGAGTQAGGR